VAALAAMGARAMGARAMPAASVAANVVIVFMSFFSCPAGFPKIQKRAPRTYYFYYRAEPEAMADSARLDRRLWPSGAAPGDGRAPDVLQEPGQGGNRST
jgi:hypothetical protein